MRALIDKPPERALCTKGFLPQSALTDHRGKGPWRNVVPYIVVGNVNHADGSRDEATIAAVA
jgi:hypothetical protein